MSSPPDLRIATRREEFAEFACFYILFSIHSDFHGLTAGLAQTGDPVGSGEPTVTRKSSPDNIAQRGTEEIVRL